MYKICLVEDEKDLNNLITTYLKKEGYEVISLTKGIDALNLEEKIDLWILDIMLDDDISGYDIIKSIRKENEIVPVIFTSARDYITKPYSPKELVLRVNNMIKRVYKSEYNKLTYEDYDIDLNKRVVVYNDLEINLTTLEFDLLILFLENKNKSLVFAICFSLIYIGIIIPTIHFGIIKYTENFNTEKWSEMRFLRYLMIEDLEDNYNLVNMSTTEINSLLGKIDKKYDNTLCYFIKDDVKDLYYCLKLENNRVTDSFLSN